MGAAASAQARHFATGLARKRSTAACRYGKAPDTGALSMQLGAGNEARTRDLNLGKVALYQLSYSRVLAIQLSLAL